MDLGVGDYAAELNAATKRQSGVVRELLILKGARAPLANRLIGGMSNARGCATRGGGPAGYLLATDGQPCDMGTYEENSRRGEKYEQRLQAPASMDVVSKPTRRQEKPRLYLRGGAFGWAQLASTSRGGIRDTYDDLFTPTFAMSVSDAMVYEYNVAVADSVRRMMRPLPWGPQRDRRMGGSAPNERWLGRVEIPDRMSDEERPAFSEVACFTHVRTPS